MNKPCELYNLFVLQPDCDIFFFLSSFTFSEDQLAITCYDGECLSFLLTR